MTTKPPRLLFTDDPSVSQPKDWLVRDVLGAGDVSLWLAKPFIGKSLLAGDMASTIGMGWSWFGHTTKQSATVYVAQERARVTARRLRAFETYHEVKKLPVAVLLERLHMIEKQPDAVEMIVAAAKATEDRTGLEVRLIILDTVASLCPGYDENSPRDMGRFTDGVAKIVEKTQGCHVALIHHTPEDNPRKSRGHSALPGMVDSINLVEAKGKRRSWSIYQANDMPETPPEASFELQSVTIGKDAVGNPTIAPVVVPCEAKATAAKGQPVTIKGDAKVALDIVRSLAANGPVAIEDFRAALLTHDDFKDRSKEAKRTAYKAIREKLVAAQKITETVDQISLVS